jgi:hypothetical protein
MLDLVGEVALVLSPELWIGHDRSHVAQDETADRLGEAAEQDAEQSVFCVGDPTETERLEAARYDFTARVPEAQRPIAAPESVLILVRDGALREQTKRLRRADCTEIVEHVTEADPRGHLSLGAAPPIRRNGSPLLVGQPIHREWNRHPLAGCLSAHQKA